MTSDNKTRASATVHKRPLDPEERFQRRVTLSFIALTVAIVAVVVIGVGYGYWDQHLKPVASVNGASITKDQWADRARLESFRLERQDRRVTQDIASGLLTKAEGDAKRTEIAAAQQAVGSSSIESLVDLTFQGQLASEQGVSVTDADVEAAIAADATLPETRQISLILIEPELDPSGQETPAARQAALTAANAAVAALAAGTPFEEVAQTYSTDPSKDQGGDYGSITADDTALDAALVGAIFAANAGDVTPLLRGEGGSYSIAKVAGITPGAVDPSYQDDLREEMSWDAYRSNVRMETIGTALEASIVGAATTGDKTQSHLAEIWLEGTPDAADTDSGKVRASHILYSPEDDPAKARDGSSGTAGGIPPTDPSWTVAQAEAGLGSQRLREITDVTERQAAFAAKAKADSDDLGSGASGGDLGYFERDAMVSEFSDALFDDLDTLKPGDIVGPVKTDFGYHLLMFQDYQLPLAEQLEAVTAALAAPDADFVAIAKTSSDGAEAPLGGDLGWLAQGQLPQDAAEVITALQPATVSEPVALEDGYHIYRLEERGDRPLDPAQVAGLSATAFADWYTPQKDEAESSGTISLDESIFSSGS